MIKRMLLLAFVLILVSSVPSYAGKEKPPEKNMSSNIENCPFYPCANFYSECENPGGTVISLTPVAPCNFFGTIYTAYDAICQFPPATFWDEVCFQ